MIRDRSNTSSPQHRSLSTRNGNPGWTPAPLPPSLAPHPNAPRPAAGSSGPLTWPGDGQGGSFEEKQTSRQSGCSRSNGLRYGAGNGKGEKLEKEGRDRERNEGTANRFTQTCDRYFAFTPNADNVNYKKLGGGRAKSNLFLPSTNRTGKFKEDDIYFARADKSVLVYRAEPCESG